MGEAGGNCRLRQSRAMKQQIGTRAFQQQDGVAYSAWKEECRAEVVLKEHDGDLYEHQQRNAINPLCDYNQHTVSVWDY